MIRFQYDHNIGQWRWNISKNATKTDEKLFDAMRNGLVGNEFTYAVVGNDEFVCMSTVPSDGASISEGTVVGIKGGIGDLPEKPSCYVGKWGKYDVLNSEDIPEGELPAPDTTVEYDYFPELLAPILDALLFGNKKLVILVESEAVALDCIRAINYMFPADFAKRIGFSTGASSIPDSAISIVTESGKTLPANIKVFFTKAGNADPSSPAYYVFDVDTDEPSHNYKAELSEFAKVVNDFCLDSKSHMDAMAQLMAGAFDNKGNVDLKMLERLALLFRFTLTPDDKTAEGLVAAGMGDGTDKVQKNAFLGAARHFWRHGNAELLSLEKRQNMLDAYNSPMGTFNEADSLLYLKYLLAQSGNLSEGERAALEDIAVKRDCIKNAPEALFGNQDYGARKDVFTLLANHLVKDPNIYNCEDLIKYAVEYFDIANCFAVLNNTGESDSGEELFSIAGKVANQEVRHLLCAILATSCYITSMGDCSPHTHIRIKGIRRMINELKLTPMEQILCVFDIHRKMGDINNLGLLDINDFSYFLCDTGDGEILPEWTRWIKDTLDHFSISQLIDMEKVLVNSDYIGLKEIVEGKLLDIDYVAPQLHKDEDIRESYTRIFNMLNNDNQYKQIATYLYRLKNEGLVEERFLNARWEFVKGAYDTLSESDKRKVGEMKPVALDHKESKREELARKVQELFHGEDVEKTSIWDVILPYVNIAAWGIGAFIVMIICSGICAGAVMKGHSSLVSDWMLLPIVAAISSVLLFIFNNGRKTVLRNIVTGIETAIFIGAMLLAFYGSIGLLGMFI